MTDTISVTFWGVRGSMPCTEGRYQKFGGNTICLEVSIGGQKIIIDMGSGARALGQRLHRDQYTERLPVLFSHLHLDHILGLPFFAPLYNDQIQIDFYGANQHFGHGSLQSALQKFCSPPFFPVACSAMPATLAFHDFIPGQTLYPLEHIPVQTLAIPHPGGCVGYRFDHQGKSLGLLYDMMPVHEDKTEILTVMAGVDALIIDAAYDDIQYANRPHWGHCSWSHALKLAQKIGAPPVYVIHHDMLNDDDTLNTMQQEARAQYHQVHFVREGSTITL